MGTEGYIEDDDVERFEEYAEDLSEEEERKKVADEQSAIEFLRNTLQKDSNLQHLVPANMIKSDYEKLVNSRYIKSLIDKNKTDAERHAIQLENARGKRASKQDESRTAKDVRAVTPANVKTWSKRPGRFDLKGIDTRRKTPGQRRMLTPRRTSKWTRRIASRIRRDKTIAQFYQYRSNETGRFIPAPKRKKS